MKSLEPGQLGSFELLAQLLATVRDPHGLGVGAELEELPKGVGSVVHMPSGDRYRVTVEWLGDQEVSDDDPVG